MGGIVNVQILPIRRLFSASRWSEAYSGAHFIFSNDVTTASENGPYHPNKIKVQFPSRNYTVRQFTTRVTEYTNTWQKDKSVPNRYLPPRLHLVALDRLCAWQGIAATMSRSNLLVSTMRWRSIRRLTNAINASFFN